MSHKIYILGPAESFSHLMVKKRYPEMSCAMVSQFDDIITAVEKDDSAVGALAIENSLTSSVHQVVDLLYSHNVFIVGEAYMHIDLVLLGLKNIDVSKIQKIYSHPQALAQCSRFISRSGAEAIPLSSTSAVPSMSILRQVPSAIIGSESLSNSCGLDVLSRTISDNAHNITRWVFVSKHAKKDTHNNKATFMFKVPHIPGSLVAVLSGIASCGGNLTKIESRPLPGTHWEYRFWIDVEIDSSKREDLLIFIKSHTLESRCVGTYTKGIVLQ